MAKAEQVVHREIEARRTGGVVCDGGELCRRIDDLDDMKLNTKARHDAFREVYDALTPTGFRLMPVPDRTRIEVAAHVLHIEAVVVDENIGQVVAEIQRHFELDNRFVDHQLLTIQGPYRGAGLSLVLLNQAFAFYRGIDLDLVLVHAALETGRWQWARMGFEFVEESRALVEEWAALCMLVLGEPRLASGFRARELALAGTAPDGRRTSFRELREQIERVLPRLLADPITYPGWTELADELERRSRDETGGRWGWRDEERWRFFADANRLQYDAVAPAGKVVMLAGPDWYGTFDLQDPAAQAVFDQEFQRRFARP
ncbi:MAG TPA: hypothetical protein VF063_08055 [Gaiellaceae bacterium]